MSKIDNKEVKDGVWPGIVVIIIGLGLIIALLIFAIINSGDEQQTFVSTRENQARKLYDTIINIDFDNNYPNSPEEITDIYNDTSLMLYGDMIIDEDIRKNVLVVQRRLLSDAMLEANPLDIQYENLIKATNELYDKDVRAMTFDRGKPFYVASNEDLCTIPVRQEFTNSDDINWTYYLKRIDGLWKLDARGIETGKKNQPDTDQ